MFLVGRPTKHIPDAVFRFAGPLYRRLVNSLLTLDTRPGRKVAAAFHKRGAPLIRVKVDDVERPGAIRLPRISSAMDVPAGAAPSSGPPVSVPSSAEYVVEHLKVRAAQEAGSRA